MYYNIFTGAIVIDWIDMFLFSCFGSSIVASKMKKKLSEEECMKRLKGDIIKQSKIIESSNEEVMQNLLPPTSDKEIQRIYNFALNTRGGEETLYNFADLMQQYLMQLAILLDQNKRNGSLAKKLLAKYGLGLLKFIFYVCKIQLIYTQVGPLSPPIIISALVTGGTTGFVLSWLSAAAVVLIPSAMSTIILTRAFCQQSSNIMGYLSYISNKVKIDKLLRNPDFRREIRNLINEQDLTPLKHRNLDPEEKIKMTNKLSEFDKLNRPSMYNKKQRINLATLDPNPEVQKILDKYVPLNVDSKSRPKAKTVHFRDIIGNENNNQLQDEIIEAEIFEKIQEIKERIRTVD